MEALKTLRREVKKYIDIADERTVKMVHAMLEADADEDWWDAMPDNIRQDVEVAMEESNNGKLIPHTEIKKKYEQWIVK